MLETAMLKVYSTEALWRIVNDAFQIYGGAAYFTDLPLERMLRDARINQIGEGANEVLTSFIALVGMRDRGEELRSVWEALHAPWREGRLLLRFGWRELLGRFHYPDLGIRSGELAGHASRLGRRVRRFGLAVEHALVRHREEILDRQLVQEPIAQAAMELYASACALSRRDAEIQEGGGETGRTTVGVPPLRGPARDFRLKPALEQGAAAELLFRESARRAEAALKRLRSQDTKTILRAAQEALRCR
jgi:alkylation response protein AidB-like acyl-CoA dehydrogenase